MLDVLISLILFLCFLPVGLMVSLLIKVSSKGPVFFKQDRIGEQETPFRLIKFRTMKVGAERGEPKWADKNDSRITGVRKLLRISRLDEFPQLINVIKGEMSLTEPRSEREYFIKKLTKKIPFYSLRFSVKPGLTGWAQVNYCYGSSVDDALEKLRYDLYYIKNMSLFLDLRIFLKTVRLISFGMER